MRDVQGSFGRLRIPLPIGDMTLRYVILATCFRMYQLRVRLMEISHIHTTYKGLEDEDDEMQELWRNWENMLFRDLRKSDRVARFYGVQDK